MRRAAGRAAWLLAASALAAALGVAPLHLLPALPLAFAVAACLYVGRGYDRAVSLGLRAGVVPMLAALVSWGGLGCEGPCQPWCLPLCAGTGLAVGAWLGSTMPRRERPGIVLATLTIAGLTAALGCLPLGVGTLGGALVGLALGVAPTWALRAVRVS
jgi:hypothetical protein